MTVVEHSVQIPAWLEALLDAVAACLEPLNLMGPLGYQVKHPDHTANEFDGWQLDIYSTPNEIHRGEDDGAILYPGFRLHLTPLLETFSSVEGVVWENPTAYTGELDGPHVSIVGTFVGEPVCVRIFNWPPSDEEASLLVDPASGEIREKRPAMD